MPSARVWDPQLGLLCSGSRGREALECFRESRVSMPLFLLRPPAVLLRQHLRTHHEHGRRRRGRARGHGCSRTREGLAYAKITSGNYVHGRRTPRMRCFCPCCSTPRWLSVSEAFTATVTATETDLVVCAHVAATYDFQMAGWHTSTRAIVSLSRTHSMSARRRRLLQRSRKHCSRCGSHFRRHPSLKLLGRRVSISPPLG